MHHVRAGEGNAIVLRWRKGEMVQEDMAHSCSITEEKGAEMIP